MKKSSGILAVSTVGSISWLMATAAIAANFNIPGGTLAQALDAYSSQADVQIAVSSKALQGVRSGGVTGDMSPEQALSRILSNTGFMSRRAGDSIAIVRSSETHTENTSDNISNITLAQATSTRAAVETVTVTSSKLGGADVQSIPIAITALSQEQLTATQTAGGPDLVKQVPNLTFSKTNFTGYNIEIRGIGTQAISVTTDPAVAVAFNDIPFIRNHFFEQEFFDVGQVEVLRGPQGTLYGRNATAGVVNVVSAKPTDQFEAMGSADIGNYHNRRFEGMINIPIVDDRFDLRIAGEWTKRDGYSFNEVTSKPIDGRDLWSGRVSLGVKPVENLQITAVWEHFSEDDDRMRTAKQLCHRQPIQDIFGGDAAAQNPFGASTAVFTAANYGSQGCQMGSLYSPDAFGVPNGFSLPYYFGVAALGAPVTRNDPYLSQTQSTDLRVIESALDPTYRAKNDIVELNSDYSISPALTLTSQTAYNNDFLWSNEDFNRFTTAPGAFAATSGTDNRVIPDGGTVCDSVGGCLPTGYFCDPQLGCSDRLTATDLSMENAWQLSQEFRLVSNFTGPVNFSVGGNYLHYETLEDYYVFINSLSLAAAYTTTYCGSGGVCTSWIPGVSDNSGCMLSGKTYYGLQQCSYIDPNPITDLDGNGHNYFRSKNPYVLNSYAAFGEAYYQITPDLKLTTGLRWTDDRKHFTDIPSQILTGGFGYPTSLVVNQSWDQFTGRVAANWTPKLEFTDQTLIYGSFAHGYKAGGANPPGATLLTYDVSDIVHPVHPLTFKPEFINAYEMGTKNTLLDGALTLNVAAFYYDYKSYQISEIVDRTSINLNFDAHVKGAEVEATWEPLPGFRFNFAGGYEDGRLANGSKAVDLIDRTAGNSDWIVVKPFVTQASNCVLPRYVVEYMLQTVAISISGACGNAYNRFYDPATGAPYQLNPPTNIHGDAIPPGDYIGFDPYSAPNEGEGLDKDIGGNQLPNAPPFTVSAGAQYTIPLSSDWAGTLRADYYWQDYSWARIFNDHPYDRLRGYTNVNFTLILTSANGWQAMGYLKNVFDTAAITGTFLNSDDTGLTTNVFLTDPRLFGVRITKNW